MRAGIREVRMGRHKGKATALDPGELTRNIPVQNSQEGNPTSV